MRSLELSLEKYDSDKINSNYLKTYDPMFQSYVTKKIDLLELGIFRGGSLLLWRDYFPLGNIVGVDIKLPEGFVPGERVQIFQGSQSDTDFLSQVSDAAAPDGFDIIIDDASHIGELTKTSFWHLFNYHLKPGGLYIIEDWGTGYWSDWPDGTSLNFDVYAQTKIKRSHFWFLVLRIAGKLGVKFPMRHHSYGMVGLIKQLVDEQGASDVTRKKNKGKPKRSSRFESMTITQSIVFIRKANRQDSAQRNV